MSKRRKNPNRVGVAKSVMGEQRRDYLLSIGGKPANRPWTAKNKRAASSKGACRKSNYDV